MERRLPPLNALRAFEAAGRPLSVTKAVDKALCDPGGDRPPGQGARGLSRRAAVSAANKALLLTNAGQCYGRKASVKRDGYSRYFSMAPTEFPLNNAIPRNVQAVDSL